jgi:HAD superfamily hydrolase (TIGR01509 family)
MSNPASGSPLAGVLFDWGDTVMRVLPGCEGPMWEWPRVEAIPGVREALSTLTGRSTLALATNAADSDQEAVRKALRRVDLDGFFERVFTAREVGHRKPSPEFFKRVLDELCVAIENVAFVGDDLEVDVLGPSRLGIRAVWLNSRTDEVREGPLVRTIRNLARLPDALIELGLPIRG